MESLFDRIFAKLYDPFMQGLEERYLQHRRKRLIAPLRGFVLEAGAGTGTNFAHYHQQAHVKAIEPSSSMIQFALARREQKKETRIEIFQGGIGDIEIDNHFEEQSLDAIVSTLVLCTIPNYKKAITDFYRWLKPGGKLVVLEHIASHNATARAVQNIATPLWKQVAGGCHLNRPTDREILKAGFALEQEDYFHIVFPFYEATFRKELQHIT